LNAWSVVLLVFGAVVGTCRILFATLPDRVRPLRLAAGALATSALGLFVVAVVPELWGVLAGAAVLGVGTACLTPGVFGRSAGVGSAGTLQAVDLQSRRRVAEVARAFPRRGARTTMAVIATRAPVYDVVADACPGRVRDGARNALTSHGDSHRLDSNELK
jgi:hypothetical protein